MTMAQPFGRCTQAICEEDGVLEHCRQGTGGDPSEHGGHRPEGYPLARLPHRVRMPVRVREQFDLVVIISRIVQACEPSRILRACIRERGDHDETSQYD